jgi:Zn-finger nucleic acid-binding protein
LDRLCVVCREPMNQETILGVQVDTCPQCAGIWFDKDELKRIQQSDTLALPVLEDHCVPHLHPGSEKTGDRRCPQCEALLTPYQYMYDSPIKLDICDFCSGLWVDDGELQKMYQWNQAPMTTKEEHLIAQAQYQAEHKEFLHRQESLRRFVSLYRRFFPLS